MCREGYSDRESATYWPKRAGGEHDGPKLEVAVAVDAQRESGTNRLLNLSDASRAASCASVRSMEGCVLTCNSYSVDGFAPRKNALPLTKALRVRLKIK